MSSRLGLLGLCFVALCLAQSPSPKEVRDLAKQGSGAIPQLAGYLKDADAKVRLEAVKALAVIGTQHSLDPLLEAARYNDPEIQIHAIDGLVNFYVPGYIQTGIGATIKRAGGKITAKFTGGNDQIADTYVQVRPEIVAALGKLTRGGSSMESRSAAARAVGILRGKAALPDIYDALKSRDGVLLYECLVAIEKIRDPESSAKVRFLLRDLDEKVQVAAIEATGLLQNKDALADLIGVLNNPKSSKRVKRAALTAVAMIPDESSRPLFHTYLSDADPKLRAAAAEGFARLKKSDDRAMLEKIFDEERDPSVRLSVAFALTAGGMTSVSELSPLQLLVNTVNSKARQGEATAFLQELSRDAAVREKLYPMLASGTKDEKVQLAHILSRTGDQATVAEVEKLTKDDDPEVGKEASRALRNLKARL